MTIAIITDTHAGARSSSSIFRDYMGWWYAEVFFPSCKSRGVNHIIHGGDFFDNRNSINLQDLNFVINVFANLLEQYDMHITVVLGNHDVAFKNTNKVHSLQVLKNAAPDHVVVIEEVTYEEIDNQKYLLVPWINATNYDHTLETIANCEDKSDVVVVGHFEIQGCLMYSNSPPCEHGLNQSLFSGFKDVWSGHFHHPSRTGNIKYLGSPFHLNWQDHGDPRGHYFYENGELEFIENEHCLFFEFEFDEEEFKKLSDDDKEGMFNNRFVRMVINKEPSKKVVLQKAVVEINKFKPRDLQTINNVVIKSNDINKRDEIKSKTKTVLDYIESGVSNTGVLDKMRSIHDESIEEMRKGE